MPDPISRNPGPGISHELAVRRAAAVSGLSYRLGLSLPEDPTEPVTGHVRIALDLAGGGALPPLDFAPADGDASSAACVRRLLVDGAETPYLLRDGHILIEAGRPAARSVVIEIDFVAGTQGLRRRAGLVYTLFVPAHARTVFPCLDQPDLKAALTLELTVPASWNAIANAPEIERTPQGDRLRLRFAATEPLPGYLFAFAAGRLERRSCRHGARTFELAYPPAAATLLQQNLEPVLDLHAAALDELEHYTAIPQPFAQSGIVVIPDFEFGGMEHPGAVFYRQDLILLPPEAGTAALHRRAGLIAHETAHLWFGDLVTMRWFDDVWLKEVCANFMADRLLARLFPETDHAMAFALRHFPPAASIDRTAGTHPICQTLDNLNEAGELYDALIYHKAPIAFAVLERDIGEQALRNGLRTYLDAFRFGNADWRELQAHLQRQTRSDLAAFSARWFERAGFAPLACPFEPDSPRYGAVLTDTAGRERALELLTAAASPRACAARWLALYEDMLNGGITPGRLLTAALTLLERNDNALLLDRLLEDLHEIYWRYLSSPGLAAAAGPVERTLGLRRHGAADEPRWLAALARFAVTPEAVAEIEAAWRAERAADAPLSEELGTRLALSLALRRPEQAAPILREQRERLRDQDQRARLGFLEPALAADAATRDALFGQLVAGQARSRWQLAALELLNHPLRAAASLHYLEPGLDHARQLQAGGRIFLPRLWLTALFSGHGGSDAAAIVTAYLERADLPPRLRQLILQTADPIFRSARLQDGFSAD